MTDVVVARCDEAGAITLVASSWQRDNADEHLPQHEELAINDPAVVAFLARLRPSSNLSAARPRFNPELQKRGLLQRAGANVSSEEETAQLNWAKAMKFDLKDLSILQIGDGLDPSLITIRDIVDAASVPPA